MSSMKPLGPTFGDELIAAGLGGLPISWTAEGVVNRGTPDRHDDDGKLVEGLKLAAEQDAALDAVIAAHDPSAQAPTPVPTSISRRQLILALATMELISGEEALAAAKTGDVPSAVQATFENLPPSEKLAAEVTWATMSIAERGHPLVAMLAAANSLSESDIDDFFRLAGTL